MPPKTAEPLTVKQKPGVSETERKSVVASEQPALQAAAGTAAGENRGLGFGIVLESPSSDVSRCFLCNWQEFYSITELSP